MNAQEAHFEALYAASDDPWHVRDAWYEQRKRAMLLASLDRAHYRHAFEPGCGNGEMTSALAERCDRVLACDGAASAVAAARRRVAPQANARVVIDQRRLPQDWPDAAASFDLILVSELGYYFDPQAWQGIVRRMVTSLEPGGMLLMCHWRHPFDDRLATTDAVHDAAHAAPELTSRLHHVEPDFLCDGWLRDPSNS